MKDCKIVQDLLPSYIEKLTSKDTNEYVESHLKNCEDCTKVYDDMKADLKIKSTTPKAEIDYMKKVRRKMRIADKIALVVLILLIIFILVFWREIFSFIYYVEICNRYLEYQEQVFEAEKYTLYQKDDDVYITTYITPELSVEKTQFSTSINFMAIQQGTYIPGTTKTVNNGYKNGSKEAEMTHSVVMYEDRYEVFRGKVYPFYPNFYLDKEKYTFWELMSTFSDIRNIRIVNGKYEISFKDVRANGYLYRGDHFVYEDENDRCALRVGEVSEKDIEKALVETEDTILIDYELPNRNVTEEVTTKLSNCDKEAGTIVAYDFKISNEESSSVKYLSEVYNFDDVSSEKSTKIERIKEIKVTNNLTYKKFQERWSGLRDLTDEDFINYTAIIMVDTDNTKEIHYKNIEHNEGESVDVYMTESDATSDYKYSASLILVPNTVLYSLSDYYVHVVNN